MLLCSSTVRIAPVSRACGAHGSKVQRLHRVHVDDARLNASPGQQLRRIQAGAKLLFQW
jgi:16S rRNA U516 pseudouridylate synthase RsuA-like enzyme